MGSKLFLLLGLSFAIVLLISSHVTSATDFTEASTSATNGNIDHEHGHWDGHEHGGHGEHHCHHGHCRHGCCRYAGQAKAEVHGEHDGGHHCHHGHCRHGCCRYAGQAEAEVQPHN